MVYDEYICSKCKGKKIIVYENNEIISYTSCDKCKGSGKVNWIENILGKSSDNYNYKFIIKNISKKTLKLYGITIFPGKTVDLGYNASLEFIGNNSLLKYYIRKKMITIIEMQYPFEIKIYKNIKNRKVII